MQKRSGATCHMTMPQCCYLAKGAKRPSHTTNTIKFGRIPFDPCNSIKRFDLSPFDQKNSTYLQPPKKIEGEPEVEIHSDDDDFASMILKKRAKVTTSSDYFELRFLLPTSNLLEIRIF